MSNNLSHKGAKAIEDDTLNNFVACEPAHTAAKAGKSFGLIAIIVVELVTQMIAYKPAIMPNEYHNVFMIPYAKFLLGHISLTF